MFKFGIIFLIATLYMYQCTADNNVNALKCGAHKKAHNRLCGEDFERVFKCVCPSHQNNLFHIFHAGNNWFLRRYLKEACLNSEF